MTTLQSRSLWTGWKLQRETATCDKPWLYWRKKKKQKHWLTFIIQTGSRSSHKDIFSGKIKLISDFSPFCYDTSVLNLFWRHFSVWNGVRSYLYHLIVTIRASSPLCGEDRHQISVWNVSLCFVSSLNVHDAQALVVLGGWRAGWHNLCAPLMVKYKPKVRPLLASLW